MRQIYLAGVLLALLTGFSCSGSKEKAEEAALGEVTRGTLYLELYEEGEIEAINSTNILSPNISWRYGNLKITQMVKDGEEVEAGDTLIVFDPSEVNREVLDAESRLEMNLAELEKLEAQHQSDMEELRADYEVTRLSQEISRIRFESAVHEADIRRKEIQLNLEKANIALARAKEQIDNRIKIQKEEVKQRKLSITQDQNRLDEAQETLQKLHLISPTPGIAIINRNWSTGLKFQIGDQTWSGFPVIQLPDLSALRAVVRINEVDIAKVKSGLQVEIKPDAFSDSIYSGVVTSVANLAVNKEGSTKIKVFPVEVDIREKSEKLLPGLTVSCRIIIGKVENALLVPIDAVMSDGVQSFVYRKTVSGYEKVVVETAERNSDFMVITKGLEEGDKVALTDPFMKEEEVKANETESSGEEEQ
ncbi:MAG: efflux RND transporter periplasmic adaptor subunit [Paludibacter sp.]|jgi:multidrug efflux pump subunit AcrA (membrane-fusion protein)|nr:efflux RND transporter periplasmic adaptor subunit [Paludibacter sp.]